LDLKLYRRKGKEAKGKLISPKTLTSNKMLPDPQKADGKEKGITSRKKKKTLQHSLV